MVYLKRRNDLGALNFLSIWQIENWLQKGKIVYEDSIKNTECYKWNRWQEDNSIHVFPCVCLYRNKECVFIETYYEVLKAFNLIQMKNLYAEAIEEFNEIKHNGNAILEWVKYYEVLGEKILHFNPIIKIKIQQEPYKVEQIILPESELQHILKFKEIFTEYYCSEEYENY